MNITFLSPSFAPYKGGVEKHLDKIINCFILDNHSVNLFCLRPHSPSKKSKNFNVHYNALYKNGLQFRISILCTFICNFKTIFKTDVFHFQDQVSFDYYYPFVRFFNFFLKKPLYITYHGWEGIFPPENKEIHKRANSSKICNANLCIGDFIGKWYNLSPDIVSYGGVDIYEIKSNVNKNKFLFVGRLENDTGIIEYINAFIVFNGQNNNNYFLNICGDGSLREKIISIISNEDQIHLIGFVDEIETEIQNSNVILTSGYLGILESFSFKKNVIATHDHALKEDYLKGINNYDSIFWVIENDVYELSKAMNEATQENRGILAYDFAKNNTWEILKNKHYKLYNI